MSVKYLFSIVFVFFWLLLNTVESHAQHDKRSLSHARSSRPAKKEKRIYRLYVYKPSKVLYGNRCATNYLHKHGFEYIPVQDDPSKHRNPLFVFFHNLGVRTALTFRNGPFWSVRARKHIKQCRISSGDFVGLNTSDTLDIPDNNCACNPLNTINF